MASGYDRLRAHYADPANRKARAERGRLRFEERQEELSRKSLAVRRGCEVPPELEEQWRALKRKRIDNVEAAAMLGLLYRGKRSRKSNSGKIVST